MLDTLEIEFTPRLFQSRSRWQPAQQPLLVGFARPTPKYPADIVLGGPVERRLSTNFDGNIYTLTTVFVPAAIGPKSIPLNIVYTMGRIKCNTADFSLKAGKDTVQLSQVREIRPGPKTAVVLLDGQEFFIKLLRRFSESTWEILAWQNPAAVDLRKAV